MIYMLPPGHRSGADQVDLNDDGRVCACYVLPLHIWHRMRGALHGQATHALWGARFHTRLLGQRRTGPGQHAEQSCTFLVEWRSSESGLLKLTIGY